MRNALSAGLCLVLFGTLAVAGVEVRVGKKEAAAGTRRVSDLLGSKVSIRGKEQLGKVSDLVLDDRGRVAYVIVRSGDELLPVPWKAVSWNRENRTVNVDVDVSRDKLKVLVFGKDGWPNFDSEKWLELARKVWGDRVQLRERIKERRQERREHREERRKERKDRS
jgi:hypothetical protein